MAWQTFGTKTSPVAMSTLDSQFADVMANAVVTCTATGTNVITLTPILSGFTGPSYSNYVQYGFVAANTTSGAVTLKVGALAAKNVYAADGVTQLTANDITSGRYYVVSYNSALNGAAGGWVQVNQSVFKETGTGSVARSTNAKLKDIPFNLKDFGGACDGSTVDTAAWFLAIAAVEAAGGGVLEIPYNGGLSIFNSATSGQIEITADVPIVIRGIGGGGIKNNATDASNTFYVGDVTGLHTALVRFENLKVWGHAGKTNGTGIYAQLAVNVQIESCSIYQNGNIGIISDGAYAIFINGNTINDNKTAGVYLANAGGNHARVTNNAIAGHDAANEVGVAFSSTTNYNILIEGNTIENNTYGIKGDDVKGLQIIGNYFENTLSGQSDINLTSATVHGVSLIANTLFSFTAITNIDGVSILGNTFVGSIFSGFLTTCLEGTSSTNVVAAGNNFPNGGSFLSLAGVYPTRLLTTAQFDATNTSTLATVTGLSTTVVATGIYEFEAVLHITADATGGWKTAIAGSATATAFIEETLAFSNTSNTFILAARDTTIGNSQSAAADASYYVTITGRITVNAAGTLLVQFAQKTATPATTSSVLIGSQFTVKRIS